MKEKFKLQTKKGQKVYDIEINIRSDESKNCKSDYKKDGIYIKELKIVYQTQYKIALSNEWITVLDRDKQGQRKESYRHTLEDISVSIKTKETYFPNGIFAQMYTLKDPKTQIGKIKNEIIKEINSQYGFLRFANIEQIIESFEIQTS